MESATSLSANKAEYYATGRRKKAIARVWAALGKGKIDVNGMPLEKYFVREPLKEVVYQPLKLIDSVHKYDISATVKGGGLAGQAGALRHGLSRALVKADAKLREPLKKAGFLTRDPRMKERKKYGQPGARKRFQFSKR